MTTSITMTARATSCSRSSERWTGVSVPLGVQKAHLEEELGITFRAFGAGWRYDWQSDGMLSRVVRPDGKEVSFTYDAMGRRTEKTYEGITTHFVWDGNVPLHEWQEVSSDAGRADVTTWLFEQDTFIPAAKLAANGESFSIVSDYLGTPLQAFDNNGNKVWEQELDIFGRKRRKGNNNSSFIPFKYQGQYEDVETGLYYNRFRYYEPNTGTYISQDPIGLLGDNPTLYGYVEDPNVFVDILGLTGTYMFTDGKNWYIGKGNEARMNTSMKQRIGGKDKATQSLHIDYGDNKTGFMVEAELMRRKDAVKNEDFANAINSPGKKLLEDAKINDKTLYDEIMQKADDFEKQFNQQNKNNKQKTKVKQCH